MRYRDMRAIFRDLDGYVQHYSVTDALHDDRECWTVAVADEYGGAYRFSTYDDFAARFPHLMLVRPAARFYGRDSARLSWVQALYIIGHLEHAYPLWELAGLLQNTMGRFEVAAIDHRRARPPARSGVFIFDSIDDFTGAFAA
jgi:hypothetical protein